MQQTLLVVGSGLIGMSLAILVIFKFASHVNGGTNPEETFLYIILALFPLVAGIYLFSMSMIHFG